MKRLLVGLLLLFSLSVSSPARAQYHIITQFTSPPTTDGSSNINYQMVIHAYRVIWAQESVVFSSPVTLVSESIQNRAGRRTSEHCILASAGRRIDCEIRTGDGEWYRTIRLTIAPRFVGRLTATPTVTGLSGVDDGEYSNGAGPISTTVRTPVCGNSRIEVGETCDDGNTVNTDGCTNRCQSATCGDGSVWSGHEACDDGNRVDNDGCRNDCRPGCGDGTVWSGHEQCDDGNRVATDSCTNNCQTARCGDRITWRSGGGHEDCDDGNSIETDACRNNCRYPECGDGVVWSGVEECDDGNRINTDGCTYYRPPLWQYCRRARCGDGVVWSGHEQCDDSNQVNTDHCTNSCRRAVCGDGIVSPSNSEVCDDGNTVSGDGCNNMCMRAADVQLGPLTVAPVAGGANLAYQTRVTREEVTAATVTVTFSNPVTFVSSSVYGPGNNTCTVSSPTTVSCIFDNWWGRRVADINLLVTPQYFGALTATATVASSTPTDSNPGNNSQSVTYSTAGSTAPPAGSADAGPRYNQHPSVQGRSQFRRRMVGLPNEPIRNGIGNGGPENYFQGGKDEASAYRQVNGLTGGLSLSYGGAADRGTYNSILQEDLCRTEGGCGNITPDGKCFLFSLPTHATNSYYLGHRKAWDDLLYENTSATSTNSPRNSTHDGWQGRNNIHDGNGFLVGRYLINQIQCPTPAASSNPIASLMNVNLPDSSDDRYSPLKYQWAFLDIPYSLPHLKYFTCGLLSRMGAYKKNRLFLTLGAIPEGGDETEMDDEHKDHYKTLLAMANNRLCKKIDDGEFGNFNAVEPTTRTKEMREIVVPICHILRTMIDRIPGECGEQGCSQVRFVANQVLGKSLAMKKGVTAPGTFIEYRPDLDALFLEPAVYDDCHSKRASNSGPHYNSTGNISGHCQPSYGEWREEGVYESQYGTVPGVKFFYSGTGSARRMVTRPAGFVSAKGYSPIVIARLAHELIHAWNFQERGESLEGWPLGPEAVDEEQTAVMGQALIYYYLCDLGFCPNSFGMIKENFVRSHTATNAVRGFRFAYPDECRGYDGIFLGPFCSNMFTIARYLLNNPGGEVPHHPELARMLAQWHANAPLVDTPAFRTVDGVENPFEYLGGGN